MLAARFKIEECGADVVVDAGAQVLGLSAAIAEICFRFENPPVRPPLLAAAAPPLTTTPAAAQTSNWTGAISGDWGTAGLTTIGGGTVHRTPGFPLK